MGMRRSAGILLLAAVALLLVSAEAWAPLGTKVKHVHRVPPFERGGALEFHGGSILEGDPNPVWLAAAIGAEDLRISLRFATLWQAQKGPARILAISDGPN